MKPKKFLICLQKYTDLSISGTEQDVSLSEKECFNYYLEKNKFCKIMTCLVEKKAYPMREMEGYDIYPVQWKHCASKTLILFYHWVHCWKYKFDTITKSKIKRYYHNKVINK